MEARSARSCGVEDWTERQTRSDGRTGPRSLPFSLAPKRLARAQATSHTAPPDTEEADQTERADEATPEPPTTSSDTDEAEALAMERIRAARAELEKELAEEREWEQARSARPFATAPTGTRWYSIPVLGLPWPNALVTVLGVLGLLWFGGNVL